MRGAATRASAWGAGAALSLVSIPLLVRHLGVPRFGQYVAVLALVNIAALASDLGIGALALREWGARDGEDRRGTLGSLLGLRVVVATAGAAVSVAFALAAGYPHAMVWGTAIACVGLMAQVFGDFALVGLAGTLRFGRVALVELVRSALGTAGIVVLVLAGSGLVPFFAAYSFAALVAAGLALRLGGGAVSLVPRMALREWRPLLADTAAYAAASVVYVVYFRVVMVVVSLDASARQAGLFATAFRVVEFAAATAGVLTATLTPVLARAERSDRSRLTRAALASTRAGLVVGVLAALVLGLGAPTVMDVIGGRTGDAVAVLRIEAASVATTFVAFCAGAVLLVLRRYRALLTVNAVALTVALGLALILVPAHGARGGATAALIGELLIAVGQLIALGSALPVARALARPLLTCGAAMGVAIGLFALVPGPNVVATAIAAAAFLTLVTAAGQLPPELRELALGRRPKG